MMRFRWCRCLLALTLLLAAGCQSTRRPPPPYLRGSFGTYDGEPRLPNGHVDLDLLLSELGEMKANTYNWLIWHNTNDWADLKAFLPRARKAGINVWVTLVPPSESPPREARFSEPFRLDYEQWAREIGRLSRHERNLVAWSIDDFVENRKFFTPRRVREMVQAACDGNPGVAFIPCCYLREITPAFAKDYAPMLRGVLFPYRAESEGTNLQDPSQVGAEVQKIRSVLGPAMLVFLDVYATPHASYPNGSSPAYIREVMARGRRCADGVMVYCHQGRKSYPEKFSVLEEQFQTWSLQPWPEAR
jgi:hypothetical protein